MSNKFTCIVNCNCKHDLKMALICFKHALSDSNPICWILYSVAKECRVLVARSKLFPEPPHWFGILSHGVILHNQW
jgi:hypothetical protein